MLRTLQRGLLALVLIAASACGDFKSSLPTVTSPTSPSGSNGGNNSSGAIVSGVVTGASGTTQSTGATGARVMDAAGVKRVEVVNASVSSPVDGEGRFSLAGVPAGSVTLKFSGTGVNATTTVAGVGSNQTINIIVSVSGSNASVVADSRNPGAGQLPVNGTISGLTGSAASFQFVVNGRTIHGDAQTQFFGDGNRSNSFVDLANGVRVEVKAIAKDNGLYAFRLHVNKEGEEDDDHGAHDSEHPGKGNNK